MRGYNETKLAVLAFLDEQGEATAAAVAGYIGITPAGASSYLYKLQRKGLLGRRRLRKGNGVSRERIYYVTEKGIERMDWLESREEAIYSGFIVEENEDEVFMPIWS